MISGSHDPAELQEFRAALATRDPKTVATYLTTMRDFVTWLATQYRTQICQTATRAAAAYPATPALKYPGSLRRLSPETMEPGLP